MKHLSYVLVLAMLFVGCSKKADEKQTNNSSQNASQNASENAKQTNNSSQNASQNAKQTNNSSQNASENASQNASENAKQTKTDSSNGNGPGASAQAKATEPRSAKEATETMMAALSNNELGKAWELLPVEYQTEINTLVQSAAGKLDEELMGSVNGTLDLLATVLDKKRDFLLESQAVSDLLTQSPVKIEDIKKNWDPALTIIKSLNTALKHDNLKSFDGGKLMSSEASTFLKSVKTLAVLDESGSVLKALDTSNVKVTELKFEGDTATVKVEFPGTDRPAEETEMVKVHGKWLPKDLVDDWKTNMDQAKKAVADFDPAQIEAMKPKIMPVLKQVQTSLSDLNEAETQQDFDIALGQAIGTFLSVGQSLPFPGLGGGAVPPERSPDFEQSIPKK